jgi:hypothetical protein
MKILLGSCVVVIGLVAMRVASVSAQPQIPDPKAERQRVLIEQTRWDEGIPAAAAITGKYSGGEVAHSESVPSSTATVASFSDLIVVVQTVSSKPFLTDDQKHINTEYQVTVQRVFQDRSGEVKPGSLLPVNLPGGQITLEGGAVAETHTPDFEPMREQATYLLFLQRIDKPLVAAVVGRIGSYRLTFRAEGMFEVVPKRTSMLGPSASLKASGRNNAPVARELASEAADPFAKISEAVAEAAKYPDPRRQP